MIFKIRNSENHFINRILIRSQGKPKHTQVCLECTKGLSQQKKFANSLTEVSKWSGLFDLQLCDSLHLEEDLYFRSREPVHDRTKKDTGTGALLEHSSKLTVQSADRTSGRSH